jgi:hypothetical protein
MGAQLWLAHTQRDYAQLLLTGRAPGKRKRGRLLHDAAQATYRELGIRLPSSDLKPDAVISRGRVVG